MMQDLANLLFGCHHRRITRPITPVHKPGAHVEAYVVCLECGKQFHYDVRNFRIGVAKPAPRVAQPSRSAYQAQQS